MKHPNDTDMDFLHNCANEDLEFLVRLIVGEGGKTNQLESSANFKLHHPNHTKYVDEIIEEIQRYAGNTAVNLVRGHGVTYREALMDTLGDLNVGYDRRLSLQELEELLLRLGQSEFLDNIKNSSSREKMQKLFEACGVTTVWGGQPAMAALSFNFKDLLKVVVSIWKIGGAPLFYFLGPAKRVVVPAVLYIANLRLNLKRGTNTEEWL